MEQFEIQSQEICSDPLNHRASDHVSMATLWNSLEPNLQIQLTQCLAELIHRIRKAVVVVEKEETDEQ